MILATGMVDINCRFGHFGSTPLLEAAMQGHKDVAQLLIESGAELSKADEGGKTPLHWAAMNCFKEVVKLLINSGADMDKADNQGHTPRQLFANRRVHTVWKRHPRNSMDLARP